MSQQNTLLYNYLVKRLPNSPVSPSLENTIKQDPNVLLEYRNEGMSLIDIAVSLEDWTLVEFYLSVDREQKIKDKEQAIILAYEQNSDDSKKTAIKLIKSSSKFSPKSIWYAYLKNHVAGVYALIEKKHANSWLFAPNKNGETLFGNALKKQNWDMLYILLQTKDILKPQVHYQGELDLAGKIALLKDIAKQVVDKDQNFKRANAICFQIKDILFKIPNSQPHIKILMENSLSFAASRNNWLLVDNIINFIEKQRSLFQPDNILVKKILTKAIADNQSDIVVKILTLGISSTASDIVKDAFENAPTFVKNISIRMPELIALRKPVLFKLIDDKSNNMPMDANMKTYILQDTRILGEKIAGKQTAIEYAANKMDWSLVSDLLALDTNKIISQDIKTRLLQDAIDQDTPESIKAAFAILSAGKLNKKDAKKIFFAAIASNKTGALNCAKIIFDSYQELIFDTHTTKKTGLEILLENGQWDFINVILDNIDRKTFGKHEYVSKGLRHVETFEKILTQALWKANRNDVAQTVYSIFVNIYSKTKLAQKYAYVHNPLPSAPVLDLSVPVFTPPPYNPEYRPESVAPSAPVLNQVPALSKKPLEVTGNTRTDFVSIQEKQQEAVWPLDMPADSMVAYHYDGETILEPKKMTMINAVAEYREQATMPPPIIQMPVEENTLGYNANEWHPGMFNPSPEKDELEQILKLSQPAALSEDEIDALEAQIELRNLPTPVKHEENVRPTAMQCAV